MPNPPSPEELARRVAQMGPVAYLRGPLSRSAVMTCAATLRTEARNVEAVEVASFRMQTIDVGPGRRVVMYEIEYHYDPEGKS